MKKIMRAGLGAILSSLAATQAAATPDAAAPIVEGLRIEPSVTCAPGHRLEIIYLSAARGDPIDGVWAFCRPPSQSRSAWISTLKTFRDKLSAGHVNPAAERAIRRAFNNHIARVRSERGSGQRP